MAGKSMKPGGGGRFEKLEKKLGAEPGVTDPKALTASIGRKKFGKKRMAGFAAKGRARAAKALGPHLM